MPVSAGFIIAFFIAVVMVLVGIKKRFNKGYFCIGGMTIFTSFVLTALITGQLTKEILISLAGGTIMMLLGYFNETRGLSKKIRYVGHLAAALPFLLIDARVSDLFGIALGIGEIPATLFLLIGVAGVTNRMVSLDRTLAIIVLVVAFLIAYTVQQENVELAAAALIAGGSVAGFLFGSLFQSTIVFGEAGRRFIGYMLAAISVLSLDIKWVVLYLHLLLIISAVYRRRVA